jgi:6-phosphogluconate dehydrogenase
LKLSRPTFRSVTLIGEAVFARCLSYIKEERTRASKVIAGPQKDIFRGDKKQFIDDLEQALYASKIMSYAQGFMLMRETADKVGTRSLIMLFLYSPCNCIIPARVELELCWYRTHVAWRMHHQGQRIRGSSSVGFLSPF